MLSGLVAMAYKMLEGRKSKCIAIQPDFSELCKQPHAGSEERVASVTKTVKRKGTCFPIALPCSLPFAGAEVRQGPGGGCPAPSLVAAGINEAWLSGGDP